LVVSLREDGGNTLLTTLRQRNDGKGLQPANASQFMLWYRVSEVIASTRKHKVLYALKGGELDQRSIARLCRLERANAHRALKELDATGLVECLTPERPRAKVYRITDLGREVLQKT